MITWSTITLCTDSDMTRFESSAVTWAASKGGAAHYRQTAKDLIEARLRLHFKALALRITGSEVLDLISSVGPLRDAAVFLSLHLLCNDCSVAEGDLFDTKARMYWSKFQTEWPLCLGLVSVDEDESGAIDDSERYNVETGVRFVR